MVTAICDGFLHVRDPSVKLAPPRLDEDVWIRGNLRLRTNCRISPYNYVAVLQRRKQELVLVTTANAGTKRHVMLLADERQHQSPPQPWERFYPASKRLVDEVEINLKTIT